MNDKEYRAEQIAAVAREIARLNLVNVVRCKDCRKHNNIHGQDWCKESARYVEPECFCSWAERREQ